MTTEPVTRKTPSPRALRGELFPEAYRSTIAGGSRELLPGVRRWLLALAAVLLVLLVLSVPVWLAASARLRSAVDEALAPAPAAASEPAGEP